MYGKFWLDGDFFVRNLGASVKFRQYQSLSQRNFVLYLTEWYPFFLLWACLIFPFFSQGLSSAFDFSTSKDFSINKELPRMNFVKCAM